MRCWLNGKRAIVLRFSMDVALRHQFSPLLLVLDTAAHPVVNK